MKGGGGSIAVTVEVDEEDSLKKDSEQCDFLWLLPFVFFLVSTGGFVTTFTVGVTWENISPFFPFISETGEGVPENFIFAFVMNVAAGLGAAIYVLRFLLLQQWAEVQGLKRPSLQGAFRLCNQLSLLSGLVACFGGAMVGNIEESRSSNGHFIGVLFCFFGYTLHMWLQVLIDLIMRPISRCVAVLRRVVTALGTAGFVGGLVTVGPTFRLMRKITRDAIGHADVVERGVCKDGVCQVIDGRHPDHNTALICIFLEWFTVVVFTLWMGSVALEFRRFSLPYPKFTLRPRWQPQARSASPAETPGPSNAEENLQMVSTDTRTELL